MKEKISILKTGSYKMPTNDQSPIYQKVQELMSSRPGKYGVKITVTKNIPTGCGLNSQASGASKVEQHLKKLWNIDSPSEEPTLSKQKKAVILIPKYIKPPLPKQVTKYFPDLKQLADELRTVGATETQITNGGTVIGLFNEQIPSLSEQITNKSEVVWKGVATCIS